MPPPEFRRGIRALRRWTALDVSALARPFSCIPEPERFRSRCDCINDQLVTRLAEVADLRVHRTTHERRIDRFAREAGALVHTLDPPSFFQALRRERIVADDSTATCSRTCPRARSPTSLGC